MAKHHLKTMDIVYISLISLIFVIAVIALVLASIDKEETNTVKTEIETTDNLLLQGSQSATVSSSGVVTHSGNGLRMTSTDFASLSSDGDTTITSDGSVTITAGENSGSSIHIESSQGGINIMSSGASAGEDIDIIATGSSVNISSSENATDAITILSSAGGIDITSSGTGAEEDIDITSASAVNITSTEGVANCIHIHENATSGTDGSIYIHSTKGTDVMAPAAGSANTTNASIQLFSDAGGIGIKSTANLANSIFIEADGGESESIYIHSDKGNVVSDTAAAIQLTADDGGVTLNAGAANAAALRLYASNAAGGIDIDAGTGGITMDTTGTTGVISIDCAATSGNSNFTHVGGDGSDLNLTCTNGSINITAGQSVADAIVISATGAAAGIDIDLGTGTLDIGTSADARTTNICTGNAVQTINIANHATPANVISIGGAASATTFSGTVTVGSDDTGYDVTLFGATSGKKTLWDESANSLILRGEFYKFQGAPTAETGAATLTAADLVSGIITINQSTGTTVALTLDTGTAMDTALPQCDTVGDSFDWYVINTSTALADTATITASTGHTIVGEAVVDSAHANSEFQSSAHFRSRRTAANTWVTYRLS